MLTFPNGSDHALVACYLELYEEGEVKHINDVWPNSIALLVYIHVMHTRNSVRMHKKIPVNTQLRGYTSKQTPCCWDGWVGGTIDILDFTFFIEFKIVCNHCMI